MHHGELLAVLENRDLAAAEVDNKGAYEQAQAAYGIATSSSLPEEWQKAESDLQAAKQEYEASKKSMIAASSCISRERCLARISTSLRWRLIQAKANTKSHRNT